MIPLPSDSDVLSQIQRIAASLLLDNTPDTRLSLASPASPVDVVIPPIYFSFPEDVFLPINDLEISSTVRQNTLRYLANCVTKLQNQYTSAYEATYLATMGLADGYPDLKAIQTTYQARFKNRCIPMIQAQISQIVDKVNDQDLKAVGNAKRPFNNNCTPMLEKYFEFNAYPSMAHRSILAKESLMAPRQIEVWFQNHRNRSKKEGKIVPRLSSDFPLQQALRVLQPTMQVHMNRLPTPPREVSSSDNAKYELRIPTLTQSYIQRKANSTQNLRIPTLLDDSYAGRPPHAYPAKRFNHPDPFPTDDGVFRFTLPEWRRQPASSSVPSEAVDMDEFAQMFQLKLNFSENPRRRGATPLNRESPPSQPWFVTTTTVPYPAPHPALMRRVHITQPAPPSLDSSIFKPTFGSTSLPKIPTLEPILVPPAEAPARKIRSLPRRIPPRSSSSSFGSRASSFSSDISSGSSVSSSSSSYSSSPEVSTPPSLPNVDLPDFRDIAQHQDFFDLSQTALDNNHPFADFSSFPANFDLSCTYTPPDKLTDPSYFDSLDFTHDLNQILS